jgi:acyl-CoA synthetase (AMP-forming)/AMP-acid ligase II
VTLEFLPWRSSPAHADRPCLRDDRVEVTYAELAAWVDAAAEQLAEHGLGRGDVVAVMLPNRVELVVVMMAAWRLGASATPVNPAFTAHEAGHQVGDSGASLVVVGGTTPFTPGRPTIAVDDLRRRATGATPLPAPPVAPDDTALLIYTSGSTGRPKGVILSHANLDAMTTSMASHLEITGDDHCLLVLPLFHVNAICVSVLVPLLVGAQVTVLGRFESRSFLETIERRRPTYFSAVPTIYSHLVAQGADVRVDTSSVRFGICGAAPASRELLTATEQRFGFPLIEGYGLTEGTCASTANPVHGPRKLGTVGVALPGQVVATMLPDGRLADVGERGEVVIQGPTVMQGYLNRPDATAEALGDGWLHTGDVGVLDEDGYLSIVDRIKDLIIRGGENLYPKEIEAVLHAHPAVLDAAVVGVPHEVYGEVPVAYVVAYPDVGVDAALDGAPDPDGLVEELLARCREHLTRVKVPTSITVLDDLPRNPVGKVDKPALRARPAPGPLAAPAPEPAHQGA